jgi:hypothetical protein
MGINIVKIKQKISRYQIKVLQFFSHHIHQHFLLRILIHLDCGNFREDRLLFFTLTMTLYLILQIEETFSY